MSTDHPQATETARHPEVPLPARRVAGPPDTAIFDEAAATFTLLATPTRLRLIWLLTTHGEMNVTALAEATGATTQAISQHLSKMRLSGLVSARREGRTQTYRVDDPHISYLVLSALDHHEDLHERGRA